MDKKIVYASILIIIVAFVAIAYYTYFTPEQSTLTHLRIGYQPSTHQIAEMTAMEKGWWKEDLAEFGIKKVTDYEFPSGPPEMQAMLAGDLDIAYVGATPPITAIYEGLDAKIIANAQIQGSNLVLRPEINYTGPDSIRGLKIATFPPGSIQDTVLRKWLEDNSIENVDIVGMGPGDAVTAISAGTVDGVFLPQPSPAIIELDGKGYMVLGSGEMWTKHTCCALVASGNLIRNYPQIVKKIIRIHIKATEYNVKNPNEAAEIYARKVGWDVEDVQYSLSVWDGYWLTDPHVGMDITLEYAKVIFDLNKPRYQKLLTKDDIFNTSFYDEVVEA